jgi:hypothetical protein
MSKFKLILLLAGLLPAISWAQEPCEFDVPLQSYYICPSEFGFYLPLLDQPTGTYSGDFVSEDGFYNSVAAGPGIHYVIYTASPDVCIGTDTVEFLILDYGTLEVEGNLTICVGDSTTLNAPNELEYDWGTGDRFTSFTFSPDTTTTYIISGTDMNGCTISQEMVITVFQNGPDVLIDGPIRVCFGDTVTFEIEGTTAFNWADGSTDSLLTLELYDDVLLSVNVFDNPACDTTVELFVDVAEDLYYEYEAVTEVCEGNPFQIFITGGNAAYYILGDLFFSDYAEFTFDNDTALTLEIYNEFGCMKTRNLVFTVNEYPELVVDAPERLCEQDSVNIFVSGSSAIDWIDLLTGEPVSLTGINQYQSIVTDTISFQVSSLGTTGCTAVQNIEIPVYPVPNVQVDSLTPFCINRIATAVGTGADFYLWNGLDIQNQITFPVEGDTTLILFGSTIYGCYAEDTLVVTAHPNPELYLTGEYTICELDTATLVATGAYYYFWDGEEGTDTLNAMPSADSLFTLIGKNIFGCADTATYFVDVNPAPLNVFTGESEICVGESTFLAFYTDGLLFQWGDGSNQSVIVVNPADDTTYAVTSLGTNGCPRTSSFDVIVNDYPILGVSGNAPVCFGDSLTLIATGADSFTWNNGLSGDTITYLPLVPGILRVEGSNGDCTTELAINITVNPTPSALFSFDADTLCTNGDGATWVASPAGGLFSGDGVVNNWFVLNAAEFGLNTVTYTYTNSFNCTSSATDSIVIETCINVEENTFSFMTPYPNPFTNQLVLESTDDNVQFQVLNAVGAIVYEGQLYKRAIIDTTEWSSGTYVIRLNQGATPVTHRIVKIDG